jgi:hypothetical protein
MTTNVFCDNCGEPAAYRILLAISVIDGRLKQKQIAFWLCADCETGSARLLARDAGQKQRIANLFAWEDRGRAGERGSRGAGEQGGLQSAIRNPQSAINNPSEESCPT